jgi:hypothetical protein
LPVKVLVRIVAAAVPSYGLDDAVIVGATESGVMLAVVEVVGASV